MANRFPIILDTTAGELKEIPSGDTLDLSNNTITGLTGLSVSGTVEATNYTSGGTNILNQVQYDNLIGRPNIPDDVSDLTDELNRIPSDIADLSDNSDLLQAASSFTDLSDTPDTYVGQSGKVIKVNPEETGFLFSDAGGDVTRQAIEDALGYTPYDQSNPDNYLAANDVTSTIISNALGYTPYDGDSNPAGYLQGITSNDVTTALGYTPYNGDTNPDGYLRIASDITDALGYTPYNGDTNPSNYINDATGINTALGYTAYDGETNALNFLQSGDLTSTDITDALGYTPYDGSTNPNDYIFDAQGITNALGFTPYNETNPDGYITGIDSNDVTTALGFTPYNSTNPDGYVSSTTEINDLYGYIPYDGTTNEAGFLQSESDTLGTVTARDSTTTASITVAGLSAGSGAISTSGNISAGTASIGSITTGTTSTIDGDTAGDTLRVGGTAALTLSSSGSVTLQANLVGSDAFKALGTSTVPFGTAYVTDGTIGGLRLNSDAISNTDGNITLTPTTNGRVITTAGSLGLPVKTPTTKGNLTPSSGDMVYVNDGSGQYAQVYDGGGSVWRTMTGPRFVTALPASGAYIGEMIIYEDADGGQSLRVWIFNDVSSANEWAIVYETP